MAKSNRSGTWKVGVYLLYMVIFVLTWIFAVLYFTSSLQHGHPATAHEHDQYVTGILTGLFFAFLGVLAILIVLADLRFEITGKWFMDIPLDIFMFENARWWEIPIGFFIAIVLLIYSATSHSLIMPLPFATSAGISPFSATGGTTPEALQVLKSPVAQAGLTAAVAPIENAALMNFPIATLTSLIVFLIMGIGRRKFNDNKGMSIYRVAIIPVALLVGGLTIFAHSLIYPPEVMQTTAISTFVFFSLGGIISGFRRSTLIWDTTHFCYNFGAIFFSIVSLTVGVFT